MTKELYQNKKYIKKCLEQSAFGKAKEALLSMRKKCKLDEECVFYLAVAHAKLGENRSAESLFKRLIKLQPNNVSLLLNISLLYKNEEKYSESIRFAIKANIYSKNNADILSLLGELSYLVNDSEKAEKYFLSALNINTTQEVALNRLAYIYVQQDKLEYALDLYKKIQRVNPNGSESYVNGGAVLRSLGRYKEAVSMLQNAIKIDRNNPDAYNNLGLVLLETGNYSEGEQCLRASLKISSEAVQALNNLGLVLIYQFKLNEAMTYLEKAISISQDDKSTYSNLGLVYQSSGEIEEALRFFKLSIEKDHEDCRIHSNLLFCSNYSQNISLDDLLLEHARWGEKYSYHTFTNLKNVKEINRRVKVGYVSPDFRAHPVAFFIESIIANHNRNNFEVYCYSELTKSDYITERIKKLSDHWCDTQVLNDLQMAEKIKNDEIDILVDLAGHTTNSRVRIFSYKPAPVQVSYLGYPNTTGIKMIDYKLCDIWTDPQGLTEKYYVENLIRIPSGFLCYRPDGSAPKIGVLPMNVNNFVTFGSFNNLSKITPYIIELWAEILKEVHGSILMLKNNSLTDDNIKEKYIRKFNEYGIGKSRLRLLGREDCYQKHLNLYNQIDVSLDTYPYNGTTTTFDALWMGVPTITLSGDSHVSRVGNSIFNRLKMNYLISNSKQEYIRNAKLLASDKNKLLYLRENLRSILKNSSLCDEVLIVNEIEEIYTKLWREYCSI